MIGLIDYSMGNLLSVRRALEASGAAVEVLDTPERIAGHAGLVLPGVGNFGDGARALAAGGWTTALREWIAADRPFLGICLGMQLLFDGSEEAPEAAGLGVVAGQVLRFPDRMEKVPHMGWNRLQLKRPHPGLAGIADGEHFYFVHSYFTAPHDQEWVIGECDYIVPFAAAIGRGRCLATQFHPEKSQAVGLRLLNNYVRLAEES